MNVVRYVIWAAIVVGFLRGLWVFDSGGSANTHETVGAGLCFAGALISASIMFCFDARKASRTEPQNPR